MTCRKVSSTLYKSGIDTHVRREASVKAVWALVQYERIENESMRSIRS